MKIREALERGIKLFPTHITGNWTRRRPKGGSKACPAPPGACVMGALMVGSHAWETLGDVPKMSIEAETRRLVRLFPFLGGNPDPEFNHLLPSGVRGSISPSANLIGIGMTMNDNWGLSREQIVDWMTAHEEKWIRANPEQATRAELLHVAPPTPDHPTPSIDELVEAVKNQAKGAKAARKAAEKALA